jgi:hypothetical protein
MNRESTENKLKAKGTFMADRQIKAYGFLATVEFIEKNYDETTRRRIFSSVSPEVRDFMGTAKKAQMANPLYSCELWSGIVKEYPDKAVARQQLVKVGAHMGSYATNTYLKLLMRMLTVKMFAKKLPDFWSRDANFGYIETGDLAGIETGHLTLYVKDIENYPYFGPICEGWFHFSLEAMGLKDLKVELQDWSMDKPDPGAVTYGVTWKA